MMLLLWLVTVLAIALCLSLYVVAVLKRRRLARAAKEASANALVVTRYQPTIFDFPCRWLAIKSTNLSAVQSALGLHNPKPCSWCDGLSSLEDHKLFLSPPVQGWILAIGNGLPDPGEDIDDCYRLIVKLSRELGQVQFFSTNRIVNYHGWVRAERGRIVRAYAWAGETLWNQGTPTAAETDLGMRCFDYGERAEILSINQVDSNLSNSEKVSALAARWSIDPTTLDETVFSSGQGIAGDWLHTRQA
ncbi:MAG: hypothetical protein AB1813_12150 [Verrucomicrobiota bacterium]